MFILPTYRPYVCLSFARETLIQVDVASAPYHQLMHLRPGSRFNQVISVFLVY